MTPKSITSNPLPLLALLLATTPSAWADLALQTCHAALLAPVSATFQPDKTGVTLKSPNGATASVNLAEKDGYFRFQLLALTSRGNNRVGFKLRQWQLVRSEKLGM